jgi:hypothetical protein
MKRLIITLLLVLLAFIVAGYVFWRYFYLGNITLDPRPSNATISVNGKPVADRTLRLPSGTYTITVSAPGYRSQEFKTKIGIGSQLNKRVTLAVLPQPVLLLSAPINSINPDSEKENLYFEHQNVLYRYNLSQPTLSPVALTPPLKDTVSVNWSPDFQLALITKKDGEVQLYDFNRYDLLHQSYRQLDSGIQTTLWTKEGDGFFYEYLLPKSEHSLIKVDRGGRNPVRLADLTNLFANPDLKPLTKLVWQQATSTQLILSQKDTKQPADILLFNAHERTIQKVTDSTAAYGPVISPSGSQIAYLDNGELVTAQLDGKNKRNLVLRPQLGTYSFLDDKQLVVLRPNMVTVINVTDGTSKDYEVYAPSDSIDYLAIDPNSKTLYYTFKGSLYRLDFQPH